MTTFTSNTFTTENAITWLKSLDDMLFNVKIVSGPYIPDMPHQCVVVTKVPGPGLAMEGLVDDQLYQIRSRGIPDSQSDAEGLAGFIDQEILKSSLPSDVGTRRVLTAYRLGSEPIPVPGTPGENRRWEYVANYVIRVATDL